jgi:hypothetical protein
VIIVAMKKLPFRINYLFGLGLSMIPAVLATLGEMMLANKLGRRTQVVKGEVCKTSMQRFESARRLHIIFDFSKNSQSATSSHQKTFRFCANFGVKTSPIVSLSSVQTSAL